MSETLERLSRKLGLGLLHLHQAIYEGTGGRVGHRLLGVPCLLLRTTGRRTGRSRTSALVYARDGEDYLVVGSLGGSDRTPGWLHNVRAHPRSRCRSAPTAFPPLARSSSAGPRAMTAYGGW